MRGRPSPASRRRAALVRAFGPWCDRRPETFSATMTGAAYQRLRDLAHWRGIILRFAADERHFHRSIRAVAFRDNLRASLAAGGRRLP